MEKNCCDLISGELINWKSKFLRKMKIVVFLLLISITQTFALESYAQTQKLSLNYKNETIINILDKIENQSEFYFMFDATKIDVYQRKSINCENQPITTILDQLLEDTKISYEISDRQIVLTSTQKTEVQQQKTVSGKVTDTRNQPLPGVTVVVKGTTQGTVTNADGEYALSDIPANATLQFSFVGMKTLEVVVGNQMSINITLEEETIGIEEVVAVGYGTMKKSDVTGSLSSISEASIKEQPMTNFSQVLQGRAAGVTVTNTSGAPGYSARVRIRGANSISGSNEPLYIVDGVPGMAGNPYDIKSVEILKDASATAIYGSRGANGVILITTKRGDINHPKVMISSDISFKRVAKKYDLLDAADYASLVNQTYNAEMYTPSQIAAFRSNGGTDWQNEIFGTGLTQNHQASVSGGSGKVRYLFSGNYVDEVGILENSTNKKYNFRANIDVEFSKRFSFGMDITAASGNGFNGHLGSGIEKTNPILQALMWSPTVSPYNPDGTYTNQDPVGALGRNPVMLHKEPYSKGKGTGFGIKSNLKYKITSDLDFACNLLISKSNTWARGYTSVFFQSNPTLGIGTGDNQDWEVQNLLNYSKKIMEKHNLLLTAGFEASSSESRGTNIVVYGADSPIANISTSSTNAVNQGFANRGLVSYFGRFNYNYNSKYFLTATYRADGSSVFQKENRFSYFPSVGLSWALSEENFIKNLGLFDRLKIRGSWGITGNQSGVPSYLGLSSLRVLKYSYGTSTNYAGYGPGSPANTSLRWERTTQKDIGLDASFLSNRLNFSFDYFKKETDDVIMSKELPLYDGAYRIIQNVGQVDNKGFEFSADYRIINRNDFSWDLGFNFSTVRNKVVDLGLEKYILLGEYGSGILAAKPFILKPGQPMGSFWGVKYLGLWGTDEASEALKYGNKPGDSKYEDLNGDYAINTDDYQITGNANPDYSFGINNTIEYKNFTFNVLIEGVQGQQVLNLMYAIAAVPVPDSRTITLKDGADVWTTSNQDARFPAQSPSNVNNMNSSRWLQDGSFIKVRNISLAYNLPKHVTKIADIRLSLSGQNFFTLTKYKGYDPEASNSAGDLDAGIDFGAYPMPRTITAGMVLTF